jgi:hypothetical protein
MAAVTGTAATYHCYDVQPARLLLIIAKYALEKKWKAVLKEPTGVVSADHSTIGSSGTPALTVTAA